MNIKKKLIEELYKKNWVINTYGDFNRVRSLFKIFTLLEFKWNDGTKLEEFFPFPWRCSFIEFDAGVSLTVGVEGNRRDLTQLFNDYLKENEPTVWAHSVLSAMLLGLMVEFYSVVDNEWYKKLDRVLRMDTKYRIDYKEPVKEKLVPDEVWDILDDSVKSIVKQYNGRIYACSAILKDMGDYWESPDYMNEASFEIRGIRMLNSAKIRDVHWKDSLCIRPDGK